jgi:ketosteroid isomerase-like protein
MLNEVAMSEDPIFEYRQAFFRATQAGDVETLVSFAADDIVLMSPNDTTVYGKVEFQAWWEEYFQYFRLAAFNVPERSVVISGDYAIEHSAYMIAVVPASGGTRIRDDGRIFAIWKRQPDGAWKVWQMMWNSSNPIGIGTNRYMSRLMQKKATPKR